MISRVAIFTEASRDIGRATAIRLARDLDAVMIVARTEATLEATACARPFAPVHDLRHISAATEVIRLMLNWLCRVDALVNIAGAVPQGDLFAMSEPNGMTA